MSNIGKMRFVLIGDKFNPENPKGGVTEERTDFHARNRAEAVGFLPQMTKYMHHYELLVVVAEGDRRLESKSAT